MATPDGSPLERGRAGRAASLFAVFQASREGVVWLSGIAESLLAAAVVGVLLLWLGGRVAPSLLVYCIALITKESVPVVLLLLPLLEWHRGRRSFSRDDVWFWGPMLVFAQGTGRGLRIAYRSAALAGRR